MVVDVRTPADEAATPANSEQTPTDTGPETTEFQARDGICEPGANTAEIGSTPISDLSFSVVKSEDGSFGLTAELPGGARASLGCIRADTDGAIEAMRLSLAAVRPVQGGVLVVLAVPTGSTPRSMDWLTFAPGQVSESAPFTVYVGLFSFGNEAVPSTSSTASEQQLVGFVNEALRSGTSSTGGIAADILSDP